MIARFAAPANPDKLEQALYAPFAGILQNDVQGMFNQFRLQSRRDIR